MREITIVDTGILVAYLNRRDKYHEWTKTQLSRTFPPLLTCEAVIAESCFLLRNILHGYEKLFELLDTEFILTPFRMEHEVKNIKVLMVRYSNIPMSFADACLVRMSELYTNSTILSIDSDFNIYRRHKQYIIPVVLPDF